MLTRAVEMDIGGKPATPSLITLWGDRVRILSPGYDLSLLSALARAPSQLAVFRIDEGVKTWGWAYLFFSGQLQQTVNCLVSTAPDGFMRYLSECTGIDSYVGDVVVDRLHASDDWSHVTSHQKYLEAEDMFRLNATIKRSLLGAIYSVLQSPLYDLSLADRYIHQINDSWFDDPFVRRGPLLVN
jgi:hypothetical protein